MRNLFKSCFKTVTRKVLQYCLAAGWAHNFPFGGGQGDWERRELAPRLQRPLTKLDPIKMQYTESTEGTHKIPKPCQPLSHLTSASFTHLKVFAAAVRLISASTFSQVNRIGCVSLGHKVIDAGKWQGSKDHKNQCQELALWPSGLRCCL